MISATEIPTLQSEAIRYLKEELGSLFSADFLVKVGPGPLGGGSIFVHVYETVSPGVAVTWHNALTSIMVSMSLVNGAGVIVDRSKVSFQLVSKRGEFKFRKISDKSIKGACIKLVNWFHRNVDQFEI